MNCNFNDGYGVWVNGLINLFYYNIIILNNECQAGYQAHDNGTFNVWIANILSCLGDADGDMLLNQQEIQIGTDLRDSDTDDDGLGDFIEWTGSTMVGKTDPLDPDTDDDGYSDGVEVAVGTNPLDPNSNPANSLKQAQDLAFIILIIALAIISLLAITTVIFYRKAKK